MLLYPPATVIPLAVYQLDTYSVPAKEAKFSEGVDSSFFGAFFFSLPVSRIARVDSVAIFPAMGSGATSSVPLRLSCCCCCSGRLAQA
jgi:hypothetical protein